MGQIPSSDDHIFAVLASPVDVIDTVLSTVKDSWGASAIVQMLPHGEQVRLSDIMVNANDGLVANIFIDEADLHRCEAAGFVEGPRGGPICVDIYSLAGEQPMLSFNGVTALLLNPTKITAVDVKHPPGNSGAAIRLGIQAALEVRFLCST